METDATPNHSGCILKGRKINNEELICGYSLGKIKSNEINYVIFEKELLAIKKAIKTLLIYLASENFIIKTDNQAVKQFLTNNSLESVPRRIRWYNDLCSFNFEVLYVKGTNNIIADYLSRPYG